MKKIIVHNGQFHADDVMAIVIIKAMLSLDDVPIERTNIIHKMELNDPEICVVDVGGVYDPSHNNFDHHQDISSPSACVLVGRHFISSDIKGIIDYHLLTPISNCDRGVEQVLPGSINSIVRQFNGLSNGFNRALAICKEIFDAYYWAAVKSLHDKKRWIELEKRNNIAIQTEGDIILSWKKHAEEEGINFLICPSIREDGQWNVISRDSNKYPVPFDAKQVFRHSSGFMAVYANYEDAILTF